MNERFAITDLLDALCVRALALTTCTCARAGLAALLPRATFWHDDTVAVHACMTTEVQH